jgi:hypothetical protein
MTKIKNIGSKECRTLSAELEQSLQRTLNKHGLNVIYKSGRYGGHEAILSFRITVPEQAEARQAENDDMSRQLLGAEFNTGFVFSQGRDKYEVTGFSINRPKFPVSAKRVKDGKAFKFPVASVNRHFERTVKRMVN